jgi:threonine dehydratase
MPMTSAQVKIDAVRSHGAEVIFVDTSKQTRASMVEWVSQQYPDFYVASAYDCDHVIEGNATLGHEILDLDWTPERIIVPIGGGGLISGVVQALESRNSQLTLVGAEPAAADDAYRSLQTGVRQENKLDPMTLADGARTQSVGLRNWDFIKRRVSKIHRVSEKEIIQAMKIFHQVGIQVEPTGALTLGALLKNKGSKGPIVAVVSGANVDADLYAQIISGEVHS